MDSKNNNLLASARSRKLKSDEESIENQSEIAKGMKGKIVVVKQSIEKVSLKVSVESNNNKGALTITNQKNPVLTKESASAKKKNKEKDQKLAEEKKRLQEEEEEKKRIELIAAQRKAKLVDQNASNRNEQQTKKLASTAASVAPWLEMSTANVANSPLNLAEIQKAERERRNELSRMEQALREQQNQANLEEQQQKEAALKWKVKQQANQIKSLAEIQAEESKARQTSLKSVSSIVSVHFNRKTNEYN